MAIVPSFWRFEVEKNFFYIVHITGQCNDASIGKRFLVSNSVNYIELAKKYKGSVWPQKPTEIKTKALYTVQLKISFVKEEQMLNFILEVEKNNK